MVNYVCRTCLYVCDNELSFKRLEKVGHVLAMFVPEIKTFAGKYSLICEQCYYFLKNVEKFKTKCIETQKKLYLMNVETIKDTHDATLRSIANEVPFSGKRQKTVRQPTPKRCAENSTKKVAKRSRLELNVPVSSTVTSESEITLTNLLNTAEKPVFPAKNNSVHQIYNSSAADDLLELFNITDLQSFREFAIRGANSHKASEEANNNGVLNVNNNEVVINYDEDEDEEYMTKSDLVSAGVLSDDSNKSTADVERQAECRSDDDPETLQIDNDSSSKSSDENTETVEFEISEGNRESNKDGKTTQRTIDEDSTNEPAPQSIPMTTTIKQEIPEDDNPGFFNKQSADGYYKCRLCGKQYKTSKGLYEHTRKIHGDEVKIHHCKYCSFFTLWKSSVVRHYSIFHTEIFEKNNSFLAKCYHCAFKTPSKDELGRHLIENHVYDKFMRCNLCRSRFSDSVALAKHVEKEHPTLNPAPNFNFCISCNKSFCSKQNYIAHVKTAHSHVSSVIKEFCASCSKVFNSQEEMKEHRAKVHANSFT